MRGGPAHLVMDSAGSVDRAREQASIALDRSRPVLEVVNAQLKDVIAFSEDAAIGVMSGAQEADDQAESLKQYSQALAQRIAEDATRVADSSRTSAESVTRLSEMLAERDRTVLSLVEEVRNLDRYVEVIAGVARATAILALNAKIEAVRAAEAGEGFSVVADEVRKLSKVSSAAADDIRLELRRVTTLIEQGLGQGHGATGVSSDMIEEHLQSITESQREMSDLLEETVSGTQTASDQIEAAAQSINRTNTVLQGTMQFQDITRQTVESAMAALAQLGGDLGTVAGHLRGEVDRDSLRGISGSLDALSRSYVSHRQREVHATATDGSLMGPAAAAIELF